MNRVFSSVAGTVVAMASIFLTPSAIAQDTTSGANPFQFLGSIFSQKPGTLAKLIEERKLIEGDKFLGEERQYFLENKAANVDLLRKLAGELNALYEPRLAAAAVGLSKEMTYADARRAIVAARDLATEYRALNIFQQQDDQSSELGTLEEALRSVQLGFDNAAPTAFQAFNHFGDDVFFEVYPVPINGAAFLEAIAEQLQPWINGLSPAQIKHFKEKYSTHIGSGRAITELLSARYFAATLAAGPQPPTMSSILTTLKSARALGFAAGNIPGTRIAFVEVTSKTLLKEGGVEFPTQIELDLPFEGAKVSVDEMLETANASLADYIVVLDVAAARVARRITAKNDHDSRWVSGTRTEPNPNYEIARARMYEAQAGLANANGLYAQGIAAAILKAVAIGAWSTRVREATNTLSSTPSMLSRDIFEGYKYSASEVATNRTLTANYYVIDKTSRRYYKGVVDVAESKGFRITYNLHDKDPEKDSILGSFDKEGDISTYEQSPMSFKVSALIEDYLKNQGQTRPLASLSQLRDEMLIDKNKALTEYKSKQFDAKPVNDGRFESVVVVLNPKGALGSGFYVAPDLVLTNYHVIEGTRFVEMRLQNGLETIGKVVKTDVRLDLALVKVQTIGKPVSFFEGNSLELGSTVEAIGHPRGLTFTLTRGIVSAVRKQQSVYAVGGKEVLFVQTDAAINPGNSGGPLFWRDRVIGVNNNKLVRGSEGLGFAIHYSEIVQFLKESF